MTWKTLLRDRLGQRHAQALWRSRTVTNSPQSRLIQVDGHELLNFCSNDYLGLANHPELKAAGRSAIEKWGNGSGASHLVCGHSDVHEQLESLVAEFVGAEKAIVFSTGYMANLAVPQTFLDRHGLLIEDKLNHASLLDAGQLCAAKMTRFPHLDYDAAEKLLIESKASQKMLMTDGVFSMDGDVAPIMELSRICKRLDAIMVVDDAHGFGLLGPGGAGCLQQAKIAVADHVLMIGTFGKATGSFGAFVAGDEELIEGLIQFARPYIYTTALPPVVAATSIAAIGLIKSEPQRRDRLFGNIDYFRSVSDSVGLALSSSTTAIQPMMVGPVESSSDQSLDAMQLSLKLREAGIWVAAIRPPTVPVGTARLRITLTSEHTREDIDRLVETIAKNVSH